MHIKLPEGTHLLDLNDQVVAKIWEHAHNVNGILDDFTEQDFPRFVESMRAWNTVVLIADGGTGIMYATNIREGLSAQVHFMFWDGKLRGREELLRSVLQWFFATFHLQKVNAIIPDFCKALIRFAKRIGMAEEGAIRRHSYSKGRLYDIVCLGILREEAIQDGTIFRTRTNDKLTSDDGVREQPMVSKHNEPKPRPSTPDGITEHGDFSMVSKPKSPGRREYSTPIK